MSSYTIGMLKGLNGATNEKHLSRYLVNNKYLIKMLMMRATGINLHNKYMFLTLRASENNYQDRTLSLLGNAGILTPPPWFLLFWM